MRKLSLLVTILGLVAAAPAFAGDAAAGKAKAALCAGCHGAQGQSPQAMWPNLAAQSAAYTARQLHAFKGAKMRNNAQMAPMVAGLSDADIDNLAAYYASLAPARNTAKGSADTIAAGESLYRGGDAARAIPACMSCHGPGGRGMAAAGYPAVSGQHAEYSYQQLMAFKTGTRSSDPNAMMREIAARMDETSMRAVAEYMAGLR